METKTLGGRSPPPLNPDEGPNFTSHRLVREGPVWTFQPQGLAKAFPGIFRVVGSLWVAAAIAMLWHSPLNGIAAAFGGALAIGFGRLLARLLGPGALIDTRLRRVRIPARPGPILRPRPSTEPTLIDFAEVSGIEIVPKHVTDTEIGDYANYELNLLTKDGQRFNLVSHPDGGQIARDADRIATLLGTEVTDWRVG